MTVPAELYLGEDELGEVGTSVGFGMTGTGKTGAVRFDGKKRAGVNYIDAIGGFTYGGVDYEAPGIMLCDFDKPSKSGGKKGGGDWRGAVAGRHGLHRLSARRSYGNSRARFAGLARTGRLCAVEAKAARVNGSPGRLSSRAGRSARPFHFRRGGGSQELPSAQLVSHDSLLASRGVTAGKPAR
jgi:hypothetical protein